MKTGKFSVLLALCGASLFNMSAKEIGVIAHRGYWNAPGSAQNSIRSLVKADSINSYGSEFDVWLTADDKLVVNHDDVINTHIIETSKGNVILSQKLENGENVPSLSDFLDKAGKLTTRLIFELKPHKDKLHEAKAVKKSIDMIKKKKLTDRVEYITFSKEAMIEFIKLTDRPVYYLNGELSPKELKELGAAGPDYHISVFKKHPEWIKECHDLGLKVNVWTVNKSEDMRWCIDNNVDFITTNEPELLQQLLKK